MRKLRIALTLEQCWHEVPGGTASSTLALVDVLRTRPDVDVLGVAARHDELPPAPWTPPVRMHQLPLPRVALYESWHRLRWPRVQRATGPVDVIHATTLAIPPKSAPLVVTVHDLAFLQEPAHFTKHGLRFFDRGLSLARKGADAVIVPSRSAWQECVAAGFDEGRLRVIPHGVRVPPVSDQQVKKFLATYGLSKRYVLWVGTLEPRKNVQGLLRAFAIARQTDPGLELVLVGPDGWGDVEVRETDGVRPLGFLSGDELHAAYAGARALCYPSFREGFGLPVLEAMAHGVPVVTSAGTSMAEFAEGAGLLADPHDAEGIAAAMVAAANDRHDELAAAALARSRDYTWENTAALTVAAYHDVAGR